MLERLDHGSLCNGSFPPELQKYILIVIFLKILEIVCVSEGDRKSVSQKRGPEKNFALQIRDRKKL
jgi:hypothetical protein